MAKSRKRRLKHKTEKPLLTVREIKFCQLWLQHADDQTQHDLYLAAGFTPKVTRRATEMAAFRLVKRREIREYIRELQGAAADAARATAEVIVQGLFRNAFADRRKLYDKDGNLLPIHEWPDDVAATVERVEVEEVMESRGRGKKRKVVGYVRKVWTAKRAESQKILAEWKRLVGQDSEKGGATGTGPLVVVQGPAVITPPTDEPEE